MLLGVDTETLETYLWARHAEERNEQDPGSILDRLTVDRV